MEAFEDKQKVYRKEFADRVKAKQQEMFKNYPDGPELILGYLVELAHQPDRWPPPEEGIERELALHISTDVFAHSGMTSFFEVDELTALLCAFAELSRKQPVS